MMKKEDGDHAVVPRGSGNFCCQGATTKRAKIDLWEGVNDARINRQSMKVIQYVWCLDI